MNNHTIPARVFQHAIVQMGHIDRYTRRLTNTNFIPIACDEKGYRLRNEDDSKQEVFLSHQEIYNELESQAASIVYGGNSPALQRLRVLFGDKTFEQFPPERKNLANYRESLIKAYDEMCAELGKAPRWPTDRMQEWLNETDERLYKEAREAVREAMKSSSNGKVRANKLQKIDWFEVPTVKTFQRDYKKYHDADCNKLALIHRHHGPGQRYFAHDPDSIAFAVEAARGYLSRLRPKYSHVYREYQGRLEEENKTRAVKLSEVSRKKFVSLIRRFDEFQIVASRFGFKYAVRKFMAIKRKFDIQRPGQRIEIDHMTVDVITLLSEAGALTALPQWVIDKLKEADALHRRIHIVAAIDVATRYILAFKASTNPKAASAVAALRMIMTDKRWLSTYVGARTPWIGRIWPEEVYSDNGSEFIAGRTEDVFRAARVGYTRPAAGDPQRRPFVESLFHSVGPLLTAYFDGKTFGSPKEKLDYDPAAHVSIDVDELIKVFLYAILDIYHNRPHAGLGGNSPHNAWVQATQEHEIKFPPGAAGLCRVFGVAAKRHIRSDGIVNAGIMYSNDELHAYRRKHGSGEVEIMFDPECVEFILVKGEEQWFPVPNIMGIDGTVTLFEWAAAAKARREANAQGVKEGLKIMFEAVDRIRRTGEAATLRANLTHVVPTDEDYEKMATSIKATWEVAAVTIDHKFEDEMVLRPDPLREGRVSEVAEAVDSSTVAKLLEAYGQKASASEKAKPVSGFTNDEKDWK